MQRVHQEDMCQALGLMPGAKYQQDGGPGIPDIVALIRRVEFETRRRRVSLYRRERVELVDRRHGWTREKLLATDRV